jgi:hypothetical protein
MSLSLKVTFVKKVGTKKEDWFYELKSNSKNYHTNFIHVMKTLQETYDPMKISEKGFLKYKCIDMYFNGKRIDTLYPKKTRNENIITVDYLLKIKWAELSAQDIYKITNINFPSILWQLDDASKRLVRNYSMDNPLDLSNGQKIIKFNFKTEAVIVYSDPLHIKKSKYKTPVRYRGQ